MNNSKQLEIGTADFLKSCIKARVEEVANYQFNIDNYTMAIVAIQNDAEVAERQSEFLKQLQELLYTEKIQIERSQIMLGVLMQRSK